jgi:hypothetical protein
MNEELKYTKHEVVQTLTQDVPVIQVLVASELLPQGIDLPVAPVEGMTFEMKKDHTGINEANDRMEVRRVLGPIDERVWISCDRAQDRKRGAAVADSARRVAAGKETDGPTGHQFMRIIYDIAKNDPKEVIQIEIDSRAANEMSHTTYENHWSLTFNKAGILTSGHFSPSVDNENQQEVRFSVSKGQIVFEKGEIPDLAVFDTVIPDIGSNTILSLRSTLFNLASQLGNQPAVLSPSEIIATN